MSRDVLPPESSTAVKQMLAEPASYLPVYYGQNFTPIEKAAPNGYWPGVTHVSKFS